MTKPEIICLIPERVYRAKSKSHPGTVHKLTVNDRGHWSCQCEAYWYRSSCSHLGQLARIAKEEGWSYQLPVARSGYTPEEPMSYEQWKEQQ